MNLLFAHQRLGAFGGAETNILFTAQELRRRGHQCGLLFLEKTGRAEKAWNEVFNPALQWTPELAGHTLQNKLNGFAPDVVYVQNLKDCDLLESLLALDLPIARMVHDHEMYCMRGYKYFYHSRAICHRPASLYCVFPCGAVLGRNRDGMMPFKWTSYFEKRREIELNRQFDRFFVYSEYCKEELVRNGFAPDRIQIYVPIAAQPGSAKLSRLSERNLILYVGQIIRGKGVDILLKALTQVRTPFECLIVGDGTHKATCQKLCSELGLDARVRFEGFVPKEELERCYLEASVMAVPSVWPEPFGMVGPEAMRYGIPVVAFDSGGIREWLHDGSNGFLVPWMDTTQFAERLDTLLLNKELGRRMGRAGAAGVARDYNPARHVDLLETHLMQLTARRGAMDPATAMEAPQLTISI